MPWIHRGTKSYYYQAVKRNRRVEFQYIGSGPEAEMAAALDRLRREERETVTQLR